MGLLSSSHVAVQGSAVCYIHRHTLNSSVAQRETEEGKDTLPITPLESGRSRIQTQVHSTSEPGPGADLPTVLWASGLGLLLVQPCSLGRAWKVRRQGKMGWLGTFLSLSVPCPPSSARERPSLRPHEEFPSCLSSGPTVICSACSANFPVSRHGIWYSFAWINVQPLSSSGESYSSPKFRPARLNNSTKMLG